MVVAAFSCAINLLYLVSPLYLTQVYSRVVTSGSVDTLLMLTGVTMGALLALAGLHAARASILVDVGVEVLPGMPAEVTVAVGARTPLSYFFDPLLNTLRRSGHEE